MQKNERGMTMTLLEKAKLQIETRFKRIVDRDDKLANAYLLIHSDKHRIHWSMAHGHAAEIHEEQSYHTASIGKVFTAVLIAMLAQQGDLNWNDPIAKYLPEKLLMNLHLYKGTDYSHEITIEHLVSNTSGLPDYFEENTGRGKFMEVLLNDPERRWTPEETIEWSKQYHKPHFKPGTRVHYSNTGFNLLGIIIEKVTSKPYHEVLHEMIFDRLNMNHSYLSHFSSPASQTEVPVALIHALGRMVRIEECESLTSNFAAGQTVSNSEDLLKFMKALTENRLISEAALKKMMNWRKLWTGIDYGLGLMRARLFAFLTKYHAWGHLGSTGSFMLYNPAKDLYVIGSFNKAGYTGPSIRFVFHVLRTLSAIK